MAAPAKLLDQYGFPYRSGNLFNVAKQSKDFTRPEQLRGGTEESMGWSTRPVLRDAAKKLFGNCPQLRAAIILKAELCIGSGPEAFAPEFHGEDKEFGKEAVSMLREWHKIFNVRGAPYDWQTTLKGWSIDLDREGDFARVFTDNGQVQTIPPNRIGSGFSMNNVVTDGAYKGLQVRDGVILDSYMRALAIQVYDSQGKWQQDISCANLFDTDGNKTATADAVIEYEPDWSDQARGISPIASAAIDWLDLEQVKKFYKLALKKQASYAVIEKNEAGQVADPTADEFIQSTGINGGTVWEESIGGGLTQIYKSGTNSDIVFPQSSNTPSVEQREFWNQVQRNAFLAIGWPLEFYDTMSKGGAALRLIMELAQPMIEKRQTMMRRIAWQIDSWRVAKAIKAGDLREPSNPSDWWKFTHTSPEQITADKGYSAQISRENYKLGLTSRQEVVAADGRNLMQLDAQLDSEVDSLLERAAIRAKKYSLPIDFVMGLYSQRSANPPALQPQQQEETTNANTP